MGTSKPFGKSWMELPAGGGGKGGGSGGGGGGGGIGPGSASGGKSWGMSALSGGVVKADPNERDMFGRTVLHLAAASLTPMAYTFLSILLRNPHIQVNLQDQESGYTALHRALFMGNIKAARDLLARNDIDTSVKDMEGMTAYDLYNGTVDGTNPPHDIDGTDLVVWGVNRNFALGTGDSTDKAYPDHINLLTQAQAAGRSDPSDKFSHVGVHNVVMSKLHTGVITTEPRGNLSLCGFGANGRLGRSVHSQLALMPMPDFQHTIVSIALGQDHTLALSSGGYVLSWGHNRFSQLGYVVEPPERLMGSGRDGDELIQLTPKRIVGPLKKEYVKGVAAGRMASACWTADALWTWGTNAGHLGYDKAANPVQVTPRRVTSITQPVSDVAFSEYAMICLLDTSEVICFHHDASFKISFSIPRLLSEAFPFRPPQTTLKPMITKVTSCGATFAALSSIGDVFTFTLPNPLDDVSKDGRHVVVKPQMIWALRKSFTAVKDVAIGSDGTVIICTQSGHVFVRQRLKSGSGQLKFRRIPYLQRVIKVATNESGAFAAIRVDAHPTPIKLTGKTLEEDLFLLQPHFRRFEHQMTAEDFERVEAKHKVEEDEDEDESTNSVARDTTVALRMCTILSRWRTEGGDSLFAWSDPLLGSDCHLVIQGLAIPAHTVIVCLRAPKLAQVLAGQYATEALSLGEYRGSPAISVGGCHPMVGLLLMQYLYSDDVTSLWDARVARVVQNKYPQLKLPIPAVKADLLRLADELALAPLSAVLSFASKQPMSKPTLPFDLQSFFTTTFSAPVCPASPCDVVIALADKRVSCSSVVLRARCPFFEAMFADDDWTLGRRDEDGAVVVSMDHLKWTPMRLVFKFIYEGVEDDLFDYLHQDTLDGFLDFVFEVLAAATELLLDRLVLVCSRAIIRHCNAFNAAALATEAAFYQATTLKLSVFDYIVSTLETMLESGLLDEMEPDVLQDLCGVIAEKQLSKQWISRSQTLVKDAMAKHKDWLALQDIPVPRVRQPFRWKPRSPVISPLDAQAKTARDQARRKAAARTPSPMVSPEMRAVPDRSGSAADGIFQMDDDFPTPPSTASVSYTPRMQRPMTPLDLGAASGQSQGSQGKGAIWKSKTVETEKVDLRSIMAEAAASKTPARVVQTTSAVLSSSRKGVSVPSPIPTLTPPSTARSPRSPPSAGGPWRPTETRKASLASVQGQQAAAAPSLLGRSAGSQASPVPQRANARIITPVKLSTPPSGSSSSRKASGNGAAWSTPATFIRPPVAPVVSVSPTVNALSLLAIQQQEREAAEAAARKPLKSLKQIQEEEKEAERAKAQEVEFMRWWREEEARVAKEAGAGVVWVRVRVRAGARAGASRAVGVVALVAVEAGGQDESAQHARSGWGWWGCGWRAAAEDRTWRDDGERRQGRERDAVDGARLEAGGREREREWEWECAERHGPSVEAYRVFLGRVRLGHELLLYA